MKKIKDVMTKDVEVIPPTCEVQEAAQRMQDLDVGMLPICDDGRLVGTVTDRDIVLRMVATSADLRGKTIREAMTSPVTYCFEDQDVGEAAQVMEDKQIRRLVVLNRDKKLVGIVSLGDLSVKTGKERFGGKILEKISEPDRGRAMA